MGDDQQELGDALEFLKKNKKKDDEKKFNKAEFDKLIGGKYKSLASDMKESCRFSNDENDKKVCEVLEEMDEAMMDLGFCVERVMCGSENDGVVGSVLKNRIESIAAKTDCDSGDKHALATKVFFFY